MSLHPSQTSRSSVPKNREREFVKDKEDDPAEKNGADNLASSQYMRPAKTKQEHDNRDDRAEPSSHLDQNDVIDVSLFWRSQGEHWPPAPIHVGEPVHNLFKLSHRVFRPNENKLSDRRRERAFSFPFYFLISPL